MSSLLFNIVIDWVLCRTTEGRRREIRWTLTSVLEALDYSGGVFPIVGSTGRLRPKGMPFLSSQYTKG